MIGFRDKSFQLFMDLIRSGKITEHFRLIYKNINAVIYVIDTEGRLIFLNSYVEKISHYKVKELIGKPFISIVAPESIKAAIGTFRTQMKGRDIRSYELAVFDKNGEKKYLKTSESIIRYRDKVIGILGIATDTTEQKKTNEHLTKMVKELSLLYDIGTELTYIMDVDLLFFKIIMHLKETFGYERASVLLVDEMKNELVVRAAEKPFPKAAYKKRVKLGKGITGLVAKIGKPYLVNDVRREPRYLQFDKNTKAEACVPLKLGNKIIGVINVESYKKNAFDEDDLRILTLIANQAAVAIENSQLYKSLEDSYLDTIKTLVSAMEAKDHETRGHSERVRKRAIKIAKKLHLGSEQLTTLNYAGYLHDIGKIGISDFILNKKDPLTKNEFKKIKQHPIIGHHMLKGVKHLCEVCKIIRSEHEKFDGTGYPDGLKKYEIPIGARIIAIADAFDAMTTNRPYRLALSKKEAIDRIKQASGTQFDPKLVQAFLFIIHAKKK